MSPDSISMIDAALEYAAIGWRIVPVNDVANGKCSCGTANCTRAGKHPRLKTLWPQKASCDRKQILAWWGKWPLANVGVATGAGSGVVVLDIDGELGRETLRKVAIDDPTILQTRIHRTGNDGLHLFFQHPGGVCSNSVKTLPGIDIRGDNGLIILPPSLHKSGRRYEVANEVSIAKLPESLVPFFQTCHKERQGATKSVKERRRDTRQVGVGEVGAIQLTAKRRQQLDWAIKEALPKEQGRRHRQVFELARHLLAVDGITQDVAVVNLRPIIERWHTMALEQADRLEFTIHGDVEESWSDFQFAWGRVKHPVGGLLLRKVFDDIAERDTDAQVEPIVWNSLLYFGRTENRDMRILIGVLFELAQCYGDDPFSLACHAGASQLSRIGIEKDHKWIYRRLQSFVHDGILVCVDAGKAGVSGERRAAKFRWVWTMKDRPTDGFDALLVGL